MALSANRVYWIQGLHDGQWQNLHHCESQEDAVVLLGEFVARDRFDELRLSEAEPAADGGDPVYTEIALMRHGRLVDTADEIPEPRIAEIPSVIDDSRLEPRLSAPMTVEPEEKSPPLPAVSRSNITPAHITPANIEPAPAQAPENIPLLAKPAHPFGSPGTPLPLEPQLAPQRPQLPSEPSAAIHPQVPPAAKATQRPAVKKVREAKPTTTRRPQTKRDPVPRPQATQGRKQKTRIPTPNFEDALRVTSNDHVRYQQAPLPGFERHQPRKRFGGVWIGLVLASAIIAGVFISAQDPNFARKLYSDVAATFAVNAPTQTNIFQATMADDVKTVSKLLRSGANPNSLDGNDAPLLLVAARHQALETVQALLRAGAKPMARGPKDLSVMHTAAAEGLTAAVRQMIDAGTNVNLERVVFN
jgi:hypothetical protein